MAMQDQIEHVKQKQKAVITSLPLRASTRLVAAATKATRSRGDSDSDHEQNTLKQLEITLLDLNSTKARNQFLHTELQASMNHLHLATSQISEDGKRMAEQDYPTDIIAQMGEELGYRGVFIQCQKVDILRKQEVIYNLQVRIDELEKPKAMLKPFDLELYTVDPEKQQRAQVVYDTADKTAPDWMDQFRLQYRLM